MTIELSEEAREHILNALRPKGEWNFTLEGYFFCPYCKKFPKDQSCTTDFCPNCGASMKGVKE